MCKNVLNVGNNYHHTLNLQSFTLFKGLRGIFHCSLECHLFINVVLKSAGTGIFQVRKELVLVIWQTKMQTSFATL